MKHVSALQFNVPSKEDLSKAWKIHVSPEDECSGIKMLAEDFTGGGVRDQDHYMEVTV